jgi:hypothetical protein
MAALFSLREGKRSWNTGDVRMLRELAPRGLPIAAIAKLLDRSESAVRNKATMHCIPMRRSSAAEGVGIAPALDASLPSTATLAAPRSIRS